MRHLVVTFLITSVIAACSPADTYDKAAFVTVLGNDTLAVETFERTDSSLSAQVILRSPELRYSSYLLTLDETGGLEEMSRTDYDPKVGFKGEGRVNKSITKKGDSLLVEMYDDGELVSYKAPYQDRVLPFIDMVHWPFEMAVNKAVRANAIFVNQPFLSGNRINNFEIEEIERDSMTIKHPFRGVMGVKVSDKGGIEYLDASLTTRKLKVKRVSSIDMDELASRFSNDPMGPLSGAVSSEYSFNEGNFRVEYGSPKKRGRVLFGGIVPWGERWRTGANRATHFYTSADLMFGELEVPAGEYTFYTIPREDGGTLIINKQTGQNGNTYNEDQDLGRVSMNISETSNSVEAFTILLEESEEGGSINLLWGNTRFSIPFTFK